MGLGETAGISPIGTKIAPLTHPADWHICGAYSTYKLYMEGLSTGDFEPVFREIVGETAALSPNAIVRLKQRWESEYRMWCSRKLSEHRYAYIWANGVYLGRVGQGEDCAAVRGGSWSTYSGRDRNMFKFLGSPDVPMVSLNHFTAFSRSIHQLSRHHSAALSHSAL